MLQRPAKMQEQYFFVSCGTLADRHMQVISATCDCYCQHIRLDGRRHVECHNV